MSQTTQELLSQLQQLHTQHLLERVLGAELDASIERETQAVFAWGKTTTLNEVLDVEKLKVHVSRLIKTLPFTAELRALIVKGIMTAVESDLNDSANLKVLVPKKEYDKAVAHYAKFEKVRMDIIRMVLESPIYSELISDVLYHGIKDYVLKENPLTKNVPGVSSLMKIGAKGLNKAMPNLEGTAEATIKKFINANLRSSVDLSERILNNALSEDNIRSIADHFWSAISDKHFSKAKHYIEAEQVDSTAQLVEEFWQEIRTTDYLHNMVHQIIDYVFSHYGERKLADWVEELGFGQDFVLAELKQILPDLLGQDAVKAIVEQRIRANLQDFYASASVQALVNS